MKTLRIGILNFHYSNSNYGAVLQSVALQHYLLNKGFDAVNIDYAPERASRKFISRLLCQAKILIKLIARFENYFINENIFEEFRKKWLRVSSRRYSSVSMLETLKGSFDLCVVGSDQVWRARYTKGDAEVYYLNFLSHDCKRISYAASFGCDKWECIDDVEFTFKVSRYLKQFDSISVREDSAVGICRDVFGVTAQHVLDPTLLQGRVFFDELVGERSLAVGESKIVYYKLDKDRRFKSLVDQIQNQLSCESENIYFDCLSEVPLRVCKYVEVEEWIKKIRDAKLVVTDSYHCICFALMYDRPFIYYCNDERGGARVRSLLELLNITGVVLGDGVDLTKAIDSAFAIDYVRVQKIIALQRDDSANFLTKACNV